MTRLRALAPAKVNLCLFLGPLRQDGRHELVTLFESISLADELALTVLDRGEDEVVCPGVDGPNLASAALAALRECGWGGPPVRIEIEKRIPVAAGLGGGSADAAAVLRLAHAVEPLAAGVAEAVARELGADVPAQLEPGVALGTGAGEVVEPLDRLDEHAFVIVPQPFGLATADVYREADRLGLPRASLEGIPDGLLVIEGRMPSELAVNDLGAAAISLAPEVGQALEAVRAAGADQSLVCGSGPTVAGIYWADDALSRATEAAAQLAKAFSAAALAEPAASPYGMPAAA